MNILPRAFSVVTKLALWTFVLASTASAQIIDFETVPLGGVASTDGQSISTDYPGLTFEKLAATSGLASPFGPTAGSPVIAKIGGPETAFVGISATRAECGVAATTNDDMPTAAAGADCSFLTCDTSGVTGSPGCDLRVTYDNPVLQANGIVLDIDFSEEWTLRAYAAPDPTVLEEVVLTPGAGNGEATPWQINPGSGVSFDTIVLSFTGSGPSIGLAFDNFDTGLCGNGAVDGEEECDDGNSAENDACYNDCTANVCGDGVINVLAEECDDMNTNDSDSCPSTCLDATCGDGFLYAGFEDCDDGNTMANDGCLDDCTVASCGDDVTYAGVEACDGADDSACPGFCFTDCSCADVYIAYKTRTGSTGEKFRSFGPVDLTDETATPIANISKPKMLLLPADINGDGVSHADIHLARYLIKKAEGGFPPKLSDLMIDNFCGTQIVELKKLREVLVPTAKSLAGPASAPDDATHAVQHYTCYKAKQQSKLSDGSKQPRLPKRIQLDIVDDLEDARYELKKLASVCLPTDLTGDAMNPPTILTGPDKGAPKPVTDAIRKNPAAALACYKAKLAKKLIAQGVCGPADPNDKGTKIIPSPSKHQKLDGIELANQFGEETIATKRPAEVCVPTIVTP